MVLVDDRLQLDVLAGVGLIVEDGLRGVGVDLGAALVLGARPGLYSHSVMRDFTAPIVLQISNCAKRTVPRLREMRPCGKRKPEGGKLAT